MLRARLFGPLALELNGVPVGLPAGATARSVLAWLLTHPGMHPRIRVAAAFWPDVTDGRARASLRTAVWDIRRAADPAARPSWLHSSREEIGVPPDLVRSADLADFERLVESVATEHLAEALELARLPLLSDLADDWVLERRDDVDDRAAAAALELGRRAAEAGDERAAVEWSRRAIRHAPLDEHAHRLLMQRLDAAGERGQALAAFNRLEATLAAEIGVGVTARTRSLADRLRGGRAEQHVQVLEQEEVCRAPALEVWKLLQDPLRYPQWWEGLGGHRADS